MVCKLRYRVYYVANQGATFAITEANLFVPVVNLSAQDNAKLLTQLKLRLKRAISWNKYLSKAELLRWNPNLNHLVEPSFQGVNRLFVLASQNDVQRTGNKIHYVPNKRLKCDDWWKKLFWSAIKK